MSVDITALTNESRLLLKILLKPLQGHRFQPTGFPDLGAATYRAPTDDDHSLPCLLVESPQSMANRMELTLWDTGNNRLRPFADGLSYVRVLDEKKNHLTSSVEEAHRLNSAYIERANDGKLHDQLTKEIDYDEKRPVNRRKFIDTVFKYDANGLLHGVFLESVGGRLRIARALSAFIEAEQAEVAASGGVKNDHVQPGTEKGSQQTAAEGFGNVPFAREEYTASQIFAYFNLDLAQIRGYGLDAVAERLLILLGLYKIRALLDGDLRLRTACEFVVKNAKDDINADRPEGYALPQRSELEKEITAAIKKCQEKKLFAGDNGITTVTFKLS
jgi:CRISPR-associated protein Csb1